VAGAGDEETGSPGPDADADADADLRRLGAELAHRIAEAVPGWIEREVGRILDAWLGAGGPGADGPGAEHGAVVAAAAVAGRRAADAALAALATLLASDVDAQGVTPLQVVRGLVRFPTAVLEAAGVPPVVRDPFVVQRFPDDPYGLIPASLAALDPGLAEPALTWGAAKALAHRRRHLPPTVH
jgi:hypothetical protein